MKPEGHAQASDQEAGERAADVGRAKPQGSLRTADRNARHLWFDPDKRAASESLRACIRHLTAALEQHEADLKLRQRARRDADRKAFRLAVEIVAANLFFVLKAGTGHPLAVPRDHNSMHRASRYKPEVYGQAFLDALDLLGDPGLGLIETVQRGFRVGSRAQSTLIRPRAALEGFIPFRELPWSCIVQAGPREMIFLKGTKGKSGEAPLLAYRDTARTRKLRAEMRRINRHLAKAPIFLAIDEGTTLTDHDGMPIDPTQRQLRRVFNNGSWQEGGRLFGGFWETMPKAQRFTHLRIGSKLHPEGEPIASVDVKQLFPHLAYHKLQQEPPEGDLYAITAGDDPNRGAWKQLLNALLCAKKPLCSWPEGIREAFSVPIRFKDAIAAITAKHEPIARLFGTGIGLRFMFQESSALVWTLETLRERGITALPLHDAVLVPRSQAEDARAALIESMRRNLDFRAEITIDIGV